MKKIAFKLIVCVLILQTALFAFENVYAYSVNDDLDENGPAQSNTINSEHVDTGAFVDGANEGDGGDLSASNLPDSELYVGIEDSPSSILKNPDKIILSSTDRRKLEQLDIAHSMIPNVYSDLKELSLLSEKSFDELSKMQSEDPKSFIKIAQDQDKAVRTNDYIKQRLLNNPSKLASFLNVDEGEIINRLSTEKDFISSQIDYALSHSVDTRVIKMLNYLVTPKNLGGAGHYKIKVERITADYDTDRKKGEKEDLALKAEKNSSESTNNKTIESIRSDNKEIDQLYDPNDSKAVAMVNNASALIDVVSADGTTSASALIGYSEEPASTVSAHFTGQAVDISEIDDIKCTLIEKRRIGGDKKTPMGPQPIKLLWQTDQGFASDSSNVNESYNQMFLNAGQSALNKLFGNLGLGDINLSSNSFGSFSDMVSTLTSAVLNSQLGLSAGDNSNKDDLKSLLTSTGASSIASSLNLSPEAFADPSINSSEALAETVGRAYIEKGLSLPYGALKGETKDDVLADVALARIGQELGISNNALSVESYGSADINILIGADIVEQTYGFSKGLVKGQTDLNGLAAAAGKSKVDKFLLDTVAVDRKLNLASGSTQKLKSGSMPLGNFLKQVAMARLSRSIFQYPNSEGSSAENIATVTLDGKSYANLRDEMLNLPEGTVDTLFSGQEITAIKGKLIEAGKFVIASSLDNSDKGRDRLMTWMSNPNPDFGITYTGSDGQNVSACLPIANYTGKLNLSSSDFYLLFAQDGAARGIFKRFGKKLLSVSLQRDSANQKIILQAEASLPQFLIPTREENFYQDKINQILDKKDSFNNLRDAVKSISDNMDGQAKLLAAFDSYVSSLSAGEKDGDLLDKMKYSQNILAAFYVLSADLTDLANYLKQNNAPLSDLNVIYNAIYSSETITKVAYEALNNEDEDLNFRFEDLKLGAINDTLVTSTGNYAVSSNELALLLSDRIDYKNYLKAVGSSKISYALDLPANTLKDLSDSIDNGAKDSKDLASSSLRSIGLSILLDKISIGGTSLSVIAGGELNQNITIDKLVSILADKLNLTTSKSQTLVLQSFGLENYSMNNLKNGNFGEWSGARSIAEQNDIKNNLPRGTTENFLKDEPLGKYDDSVLDKDSLTKLSEKLNISESSIKTYISNKEGSEDAKTNKIYYKSYNSLSTQNTNGADLTAADNKYAENGYAYYDTSGFHLFPSYYDAEQYRIANSNKEVEPLHEIASGIMNSINSSISIGDAYSSTANQLKEKFVDANTLANSLKDFASNASNLGLLDTAGYQLLENFMYDKLGISRGITETLFTRGLDGSVDYLKTLAMNYLKTNVVNELNREMKSSLLPGELSSLDIMDIINGQGDEALIKAGTSMLESEMGLGSGTILSILQSDDDKVRTQKMMQASFDMIANALGIEGGVSIDGNLLANLGQGKIESILDIADRSFIGGQFSELLASMSPMELVKALHLPVDKDTTKLLSEILGDMGVDSSSAYTSANIYDQLGILKSFMQNKGLDLLSDAVKLKISDLSNRMGRISSELGNIPELFSENPTQALETIKSKLTELNLPFDGDKLLISYIEDFQSQLTSIERKLGVDLGSFAKILKGEMAPRDMLKLVGTSILGIGENGQSAGQVLLQKLGLEGGDTITADILNKMVNGIISNGDPFSTISIDEVKNTLLNLFSFNLDQKTGFEEGTFKKIISNPGDAWSILLDQGMRGIDGILSGDPDASAFRDVIGAKGALILTTACDIATLTNIDTGPIRCLNQASTSSDTTSGKDAIMDRVASRAQSYLAESSEVTEKVETAVGTVNQKVGGIVADTNTLKDVFKGDFRVLQVIGIINNISAIIGDDDGLLAVPENFLIEYGDIAAAVYGVVQGDPNADDVLAQRAVQYVVSKANGSNPALGYFVSTAATALFTPGGLDQLTIQYPLSAAANFLFPTEPERGTVEHLGWALLQSRINYTESMARANLTDMLAQELQYKIMDCSIFKKDKFIPEGFAKAMFAGNAFDKASVFADYMKQWFQNIQNDPAQWAGQFLPEEWQGVYNFFISDGPKDMDSLIQQFGPGLVTKLDDFITSKAPTILGVNLGKGVAGSLMTFIQTGNLETTFQTVKDNVDVVINSFKDQFTIEGAVSMVGGWVDKKLGLPAGTVASIYNNWSTIAQAQFEFAGLALSGPVAFAASLLFNQLKSFVIGQLMNLANQILSPIESALGLVPGSIMALILSGFSPLGIAIFVITNLFGVYKVEMLCTADGYYPKMESAPDETVWDVPNLGTFDGFNQKERQAYSVKAAQYKADRLIKDAIDLPDDNLPVQIMTGRQEDALSNAISVSGTICPKVRSSGTTPGTSVCRGWNSRSGLWANPQTIAWTHIGF